MASSLLCVDGEDGDSEVGLYFVVPLNLQPEDCDKDMLEAFKNSQDSSLEPTWKFEEDCLRMNPTKRTVFVFQMFEGVAFNHLKEFKCVSITGPRCLNHSILFEEPIPGVSYPTFTAAMKGLVVTCSGGGAEMKNQMKEKIELMGGTYAKSFTAKTTHVIVWSVVSTKYEKALELGIPVRTYKWIGAVWEQSLKEYVRGDDPKFDVFKCPPFLNLTVCSTGLIIKEIERLKNTVTKHGGTYSPSLFQQVNVLVVKNRKGDKYKYAQSWSIPCVEARWIYDSVQNGHALPTKTYEVHGRAASSPTAEEQASVLFSANVSNICFDQRTHVEESIMNASTSSISSYCPAPKATTPLKMNPPAPKGPLMKTPSKTHEPPPPKPGELKHLLQDIDISQTKKAGSFLDGCGVYIVGWNPEEEECLKKILKCSGAARFSDLSDRVSHILVGNLEKSFLRTLKNLHHKPHVVNIKWLIQSLTDGGPAAEEPFSCFPSSDVNTSEAPSPLSKKGMALLKRETFSPEKVLMKQSSKQDQNFPSPGENTLLAKYMSSEASTGKAMSTSTIEMPPPPVPSSKSKPAYCSDISGVAGSQEDMEIFAGLRFIIVGLAEEAAQYVEKDLVCKYGGAVVPKSFKGVPDYAVVPLTGATLHQTASEIVTSLWLESCIEAQEILPVVYYHQPVVLDETKRPLEGCVLGLSGFSGKERQFILELASALGAVCQDVFAKKSKSNAKASSHLICKTNEETEKFKAAMKWGRPALHSSWLLACASNGTLSPLTSHLVNSKQVLTPLIIENSNSGVADSSVIQGICETSQVAALKQLDCFKTPERTPMLFDQAEVDRILNWVPSPNPHAIATPPFPLGISENPTPGESKRMQKFINKLPGKMPTPPPRRDSTPLHELRKRVIEAFSVTTPEMLHLVPIKDKRPPLEEVPASANNGEAKIVNTGLSSSPVKSVLAAASVTPTTANSSTASRKLFNLDPIDSPIDGQLDKLKKLIATPDHQTDGPSTKITGIVHEKFVGSTEKHVLYDSLKDASQPYAIKWEDPINMKRPLKADHISLPKQNDVQQESSKRKSSESAEDTPELKKLHCEQTQMVPKEPVKVLKFCLSSVQEKEPYSTIINQLGGILIESSSYSLEATHLILEKPPQRSEKLLAFIASGKWILHISYLHECQKQKKFVDEENFEWGNPSNQLISRLKANSVEEALAKAAYRWRTEIGANKCRGAFESFTCKIYTSEDKVPAFTRLVTSGGGEVIPTKSSAKPSLCLVHNSVSKEILVEHAKAGIPCVPLTYLYDHLTCNPSPDPQSRTLDEYKKLREKLQRC